MDEFKREIHRICAQLTQTPKQLRRAKFEAEINALPEAARDPAMCIIATMVEITADDHLMKKWEKITMIASGGGFILILLGTAIFIPHPTQYQVFVFRIVLGLAAAAFGCTLPGLLTIDGQMKMLSIRASGAIALFLLVYLVNPPRFFNDSAEPILGDKTSNTNVFRGPGGQR